MVEHVDEHGIRRRSQEGMLHVTSVVRTVNGGLVTHMTFVQDKNEVSTLLSKYMEPKKVVLMVQEVFEV
jgi:hypothetical protein